MWISCRFNVGLMLELLNIGSCRLNVDYKESALKRYARRKWREGFGRIPSQTLPHKQLYKWQISSSGSLGPLPKNKIVRPRLDLVPLLDQRLNPVRKLSACLLIINMIFEHRSYPHLTEVETSIHTCIFVEICSLGFRLPIWCQTIAWETCI